MKIVTFDNDKSNVRVWEDITNPQQKGKNEVLWDNGNMFGVTNYVILNDNQNFADLTDADIQAQFATQIGVPTDLDKVKTDLAQTQAVLNDLLLA